MLLGTLGANLLGKMLAGKVTFKVKLLSNKLVNLGSF